MILDEDPLATWKRVAASLDAEAGADNPPVSAFDLAAIMGLDLQPWGKPRGARSGDTIWYPEKARPVRQHGSVAHELGHWTLEWAEEPNTEDGARYIAGALLLPRRPFERDLDRTGWHWETLRARHANASAEMIARRITQVRDAVATVIDQGKVRARVTSPWLPDPRLRRITRWERGLAEQALEEGETVHGDELCYAVPVLDPPWQRVVAVCEARQLSLRI